jgi:hypothetical protein
MYTKNFVIDEPPKRAITARTNRLSRGLTGWAWRTWLLLVTLLATNHVHAQSRIFNLNVHNNTLFEQTFIIVPGSCYEGTGNIYTDPGGGDFTLTSGENYTLTIARVQGNGCDGKQGYFGLQPTAYGFSAQDRTNFNFSNDGGLQMGEGLSNSYDSYLSAKSKVDESFSWVIQDLNNRLSGPPDQRLMQPRSYIAADTGVWDRVDRGGSESSGDVLIFEPLAGGGGAYFETCFGNPLYHPQHMVRLPNKDGRAYFMVSQSRGHNGSLFLLETFPGRLDQVTDLILPDPGKSIGRVIWEEVFTGDSNGKTNPIGNWNHPGKMHLIGGVLVVAAQNWSEGMGVDVCTGDSGNPYLRGTSEDAVLFFDVRDSSSPKYWGKMTASELQLPQSKYNNGPRFDSNFDSMISSVTLNRVTDADVSATQNPVNRYQLTAGGRRNGENFFTTWETDSISPNIQDWTKKSGPFTYFSGEHGTSFTSYETRSNDLNTALAPAGTQRQVRFEAANTMAGFGDIDGFKFSAIASQPSGSALNKKVFNNISRSVDWIAEDLYISRQGVPIAYTVENDSNPDGERKNNWPYIYQVSDDRNLSLSTPHEDRFVTNANPRGPGSLREALAYGGRIRFSSSLNGATIVLYTGPLVVDLYDVEIDATGLDDGITIERYLSFDDSGRVLHITKGKSVTLKGITITGGNVFERQNFFGAIPEPFAGDGGGILNEGSLVLERSTVSGNSAQKLGAGIYNSPTGALYLTNTTVAQNGSNLGGGIVNYGYADIRYSTVADNTGAAAGIAVFEGSSTLLMNSIVSNNIGGGTHLRAIGQAGVYFEGNNIVDQYDDAVRFGGPEPIVVERLSMAVLGDYGGPSYTMPPSRGTIAIDSAIDPVSGDSEATVDQRGVLRPVGLANDIGAVEVVFGLEIVNTNPSGPGSLRQAINNGGGDITFAASLDGGTITLDGLPIDITNFVKINASSLPNGLTISGDYRSRIFSVFNTATSAGRLELQGVKLSHGNAESGGAISVFTTPSLGSQSSLTIKDSTFKDNNASIAGGAIYNQDSNVDIKSSSFYRNTVVNRGGAIASISEGYPTYTTISYSTLAFNTARHGGALYSANAYISLIKSTVASNRTNVTGGLGGNIVHETSVDGELYLRNSIIEGGSLKGTGAGPDLYYSSANPIVVFGKILLENNNTVEAQFPNGNPNSDGHVVGVSAMLDPLRYNGGPTLNMALRWGSPAIDIAERSAIGAVQPNWNDSDGDGIIDLQEEAEGTNASSIDSDSDGLVDGDGASVSMIDYVDGLDNNSDGYVDGEADLGTNPNKADTDNDGLADGSDAYPLVAIGDFTDTDNDGAPNECDESCAALGMTADSDDDNDGIGDNSDAYSLVAIGDLLDTDNDGAPNECDESCIALGMTADSDDDNDGIADVDDAYPLIPGDTDQCENTAVTEIDQVNSSGCSLTQLDSTSGLPLWLLKAAIDGITQP